MSSRALVVALAAVAASVLALITSSTPQAASGGLIAAYSFDEGSGAAVHDSTGTGNNGTTRDATWSSAGRFGGALTFNGTSSWVTIPDSPSLDLTKGFTIEAWVRPAAAMGTSWQTVAFKEGTGDLAYGLYANGDTASPVGVANTTGGKLDVRGTPLPPNVWSHIATTWDGSSLRFYVNATLIATRGVTGTLPVTSGPLHVGGNAVRGEWFQGDVDDLRIYGQAQAASRISSDMTTPVVLPSGPPAPADITPPTAPTGLTATNVAGAAITASWTPSTDNVGVTGYNLFRDGIAVGTSAASVFTFSGLSCGTNYGLGVEAVDAAGNVSGRTTINQSTLPCPDTTAPTAPAAFAAGATGTDSITTSWTASTDNVAVAGYTLYVDGVANGTATGSPYTFAGLVCGTSYALGVEAFDAAGNVSPRAVVTAATAPCPDVTAPSAPASFAPGATDTTSIATSWAASTDNVGVAGYTLYRDGVAVGKSAAPPFTFSGLVCGTSYSLGVEAFDASGNVSPRTAISAATTPCPDLTPPSAPSSPTAGTATRTSIPLSWTASSDNVAVAGYTLSVNGATVGTTTATSFTFAGLTCGTSYVLGVEAFDAAGNVSARSTLSAPTADCPDVIAPSAPSALSAGAATTSSIAISWAASTDNVGVAGYGVLLDGVATGTTTATSFTFAGLACGTTHTLGVQAFDAAGNVSTRSSVTAATAACPDTTAPTAPTGLAAANATGSSFSVSWAASSDNVGVTGYTVLLDGAAAGTTTTTSFAFTGLACGTTHVVDVKAFDAAGNVSTTATVGASTAACAVDVTKPSAPTAFAVTTPGKTSLVVGWTASTDNVGVAGYTLYRSGVSQGKTTATTFTYTGMSCSGAYTLGVEAFDAAGNVSARTTITGFTLSCPDTIAPSAPIGVVATSVGPTSVALSWSPSTDNVGVTGYSVFRDGVSAGTTAGTAFTVSGLTCGTSHVLGVQAFDAAGNNSTRTSITVSTAACPETVPPSTPSGLSAGASPTSLALSWTASTDNVGVTGYTLFLDGASAGTTTTTSFTFTGLTCATSHSLGVQAFDAAGNVSARSSITATTSACPDVTAPTAPAGLAASAATTSSLGLAWTASTDNVGVAGYTLLVNGAVVGTTAGTSFTFAGLACGTTYTLGVQAFDAAGNTSVATSIDAVTAACPDLTAPSAPAGLTAGAATGASIPLAWTPSTDNVGVAGYTLTLNGAVVGTTTAASFTFAGLVCGTSYVLGVEAFDAAGNVSARSTLTASTSACPDVTAPSAPTGLAVSAATGASVALAWTRSTDNVGVAGYTLTLNGAIVGTTTAASFTFAGLVCGTSYVLGVEAFDAAGNVSARSTLNASTTPCPDTTPPTAPPSFVAGTATATTIPTSWAPSTDNVAVAGYNVYRDGANIATISGASVATAASVNFTFAGLACGTSYVLAVEAFDAAGNVSARPSLTASTSACADTTPPQVSVTAPAAGATVSATVKLTASATDAGGIASVQFTVDGVNAGAPVTVAPYTANWDTLAVANGPHAIAARATDVAGNSATSAAVSVTVQNAAFDTTNAFKKVDIGPGFMDAALHGVVRTAGGRVYVFSADDTAERKGTGPGVIHAYRGDQLGIPISFTEVDAAHRPSATGTTHVVGSPDVRLDKSGVAHMVYTDETNATLWYETFSTVTDTWGPRVSLATGVDIPAVAIKRETSNALALDANDVPHVVYAGGGVVQYRDRVGGTWNAPVTISTGGTPIHVSLAAAPDGTLDLAWLQGAIAPSSIRFAQRSALGTWSAPETVASGDVLDNSNADQGPSVAFSATNEPYVLYVSALPTSAVRVRHRAGGAWTLDPTPTDFFTHTPQIYMQGNDVYAFLGHDAQIRFAYAYHLAGQAWSPLTALTSTIDGTLDGSASIRFDPLHETNAGIIDATFWDEDQLNNKTYFPEAYYMAIVPSGTGGGATPPSSDTTAPTVSVTAPASGATVSGAAVALTASAADNVGVAGVQFKLDGANLGAELTAAPYNATWDTTTATNGTHTLTAVARDAAGNTATASSVTVTVSNAGTPAPPPAGTVLVGNAATESKVDSDPAGQAEAFKASAAVSGSVTRLRVFLDGSSTSGRVVVGLYTNTAAGHPGTLLTSGVITAPAAGQNNEVAVTAASVTAGQTYWIAVLGSSGTLAFRDRGAVGAGSSEASAQAGLTALPASWTSGASFTDGLISAVGLG